ncbi:HlyD family secretion protein [Falsiroseomonas sp. HW251]|uniref:HlyD family secretion protein n=1 Tax=Falsiroseomonas sp. HW251 TaxID=3390998 RepID=UPI003D31CB3B
MFFAAMVGLSVWYLTRPEPLLIQGEVQSRSFDMAPRVDGRIARILVARSEDIRQGAPLLRIENPELLARLRQNEAELAVARAELARVEAGFRAETIATRRAQVDRAAADLTLAQQTYDRVRQLAADRFAPQAQLDQATAARSVAQRGLEQARFAYNEAVAGFIPEDHAIAQAKVASAEAALQTTQSLVDQLVVAAPADSQVFRISAEAGEVAVPGIPLLSLVDMSDMWVQFDLREDLLRGLSPGARLLVRVPALQDREVEVEIRVIAPHGEYTGWRATRATGDFDLRTFEVRAYPAAPVPGLRPGMSVYADWSGLRR